MALNLSPNEMIESSCPTNAAAAQHIKNECIIPTDAASRISHINKMLPVSSSSSSPSLSPNYELLTAFRSEIVVMPESTHTKIRPIYKRYGCGICEQNYPNKKRLNKHVTECHAVDKNYKCDICGKRFRLKNSLNLHAITHTGVKAFKCTTCDKRFTQKSSLNTHVKQFHATNVKMFECNDCTKKFKLKYFLDMHHLTHNGRKPYKCNICDSRFTQKSSLNTHVKQFHESSVPMFQCMRCDKKFLRETMLDKHIENHP